MGEKGRGDRMCKGTEERTQSVWENRNVAGEVSWAVWALILDQFISDFMVLTGQLKCTF